MLTLPVSLRLSSVLAIPAFFSERFAQLNSPALLLSSISQERGRLAEAACLASLSTIPWWADAGIASSESLRLSALQLTCSPTEQTAAGLEKSPVMNPNKRSVEVYTIAISRYLLRARALP